MGSKWGVLKGKTTTSKDISNAIDNEISMTIIENLMNNGFYHTY